MASNAEEDDHCCSDWDDDWEEEFMLDNMAASETKSALVPKPRPVYRKPVEFKIKNIMDHLYGHRRTIDNNNARVVSLFTTPDRRPALSHSSSLSEKLDKPAATGLTSTKTVQYGLAGVAIGLGSYMIYKMFTRK